MSPSHTKVLNKAEKKKFSALRNAKGTKGTLFKMSQAAASKATTADTQAKAGKYSPAKANEKKALAAEKYVEKSGKPSVVKMAKEAVQKEKIAIEKLEKNLKTAPAATGSAKRAATSTHYENVSREAGVHIGHTQKQKERRSGSKSPSAGRSAGRSAGKSHHKKSGGFHFNSVRSQFLNYRENVLNLEPIARGSITSDTAHYAAIREAQRICEQLFELYGDRISREHLINIATEFVTDIAGDESLADSALHGQEIDPAMLHNAVEEYYANRIDGSPAAPAQQVNPLAAAAALGESVVGAARGLAASVGVGTSPSGASVGTSP